MWEQGYFCADPYPAYVYRALNPHYLAYLGTVNGFATPSPTDSFRYCELGCAQGSTLLPLAAANPTAEFVGIDLMPEHIQCASELVTRSELRNVRLHQTSFTSIGTDPGDLGGKFDFIVAHGIYSWVNSEARLAIDRFLRTHLADGGLAYVCYNTMPGSAWRVALSRALYAVRTAQTRSGEPPLSAARRSLNDLLAKVPLLASANGALSAELESLDRADAGYLAHEYFNEEPLALFAGEFEQRMAQSGLTYVASAFRGHVATSDVLQRRMQEAAGTPFDSGAVRAAYDVVSASATRCDLFAQDVGSLDETSMSDRLGQTMIHRAMGIRRLKPPAMAALGDDAALRQLAERMFSLTETGPVSVRDAIESVETFRQAHASTFQTRDALMLLLDAGAVEVRTSQHSVDKGPADAWNAVVLEDAESGRLDFPLTSPVSGAPIIVGIATLLAISALTRHGVPCDPAALVDWMLPRMPPDFPTASGAPLGPTTEERRAAVLESVHVIIDSLPAYRALGLIDA
jgi:SAM-dependent methyltransferase